ncbi:MAG: ice-binding family protein [Cyclobacteriaceae bacterium]|nr:ice-binding family protein [Cyclobacteriaceae bacterium]
MKKEMKVLFTALALSAVAMFVGCESDDDKNVDPNPPTVVSTIPAPNATGLARNEVIEFTSSELMNATTITNSTFLLKQGSTNVPGNVEFSGINGKFTPTQYLAPGTIYTAIITSDVEDLEGNAMEENYEWSFTTGGTTATLVPIDLGAAGNYVILAKTAINNSPTSVITGDAGISPAAETYMTGFALVDDTGFATSSQVSGRVYAADMEAPTPTNLTTAVDNMNTAYNAAAGLTSPDFVELHEGGIGGKTLAPGVYNWTNTVLVPTNLTIFRWSK